MIRTSLAVLALVAAARIAHADDTFESKSAGATRIHRVENLVWALTAPCDQGDDTEQRQCRIVRDKRAAELANQTFVIDADRDAFDAGAWNAQKKSSNLSVNACIRCSGVDLDGKTWFLVGGTGAPRVEGGKMRPTVLAETARAFPDAATADAFAKRAADARVQMVVKLAPKAKWADGGKQGLALEILAFRVVACDGSVILANPPSGPAEADKKSCGTVVAGKPADEGPKAETLSMTMIKDTLKPVVLAGQQCYSQFAVAGNAKLKLTVNGDGSVAKYEQQGDFVGTPTGDCIDKAMKHVAFPRTKKPQTSFTFPLQLK
jgi:hypothetical protein